MEINEPMSSVVVVVCRRLSSSSVVVCRLGAPSQETVGVCDDGPSSLSPAASPGGAGFGTSVGVGWWGLVAPDLSPMSAPGGDAPQAAATPRMDVSSDAGAKSLLILLFVSFYVFIEY